MALLLAPFVQQVLDGYNARTCRQAGWVDKIHYGFLNWNFVKIFFVIKFTKSQIQHYF